ncbi:MAG: sporulation integral membrane protein YtvI [Oscillospiraceae bacterium]|nr:sporulation integral membrane protein YtvI [Oscillospiraceae bacterium]
MIKTPPPRSLWLFLLLPALWIGLKYALPVVVPFLLGGLVALAAEPVARPLTYRLHLPRPLAAGISVTLVLVLLTGTLLCLLAVLAKQATRIGSVLPDLTATVGNGLATVEDRLLRLSTHAPEALRPMLTDNVSALFTGSDRIMEGIVSRGLSLVSRILTVLTDGTVVFATGILAAYMISARLPRIHRWIGQQMPPVWQEYWLPALKGMKKGVTGYLLAQLKLSGIAFLILVIGFLLLQIPNGPLWAFVISIVDAFPILGCGTVLLPWALICLLRGQRLHGLGLLGTWTLVWLIRSVLEPRLLGKELGLDPLITLIAVYGGLKLFGLPGILLAPLLVMTVLRLIQSRNSA